MVAFGSPRWPQLRDVLRGKLNISIVSAQELHLVGHGRYRAEGWCSKRGPMEFLTDAIIGEAGQPSAGVDLFIRA
eukprot:7362854-Pyramimonas_sp.AAC.1